MFQNEETWTYLNQRPKTKSMHSFLKQCCARFSIDTISWYLQLIFQLLQLTSAASITKLSQLKLVQNNVLKTNGLHKYLTNVMATLVLHTAVQNVDGVHCVVDL